MAINELYARHGRGFAEEEYSSYFHSKSWYAELYTPEEYDSLPSQFNECEQANLDALVEIRDARAEA